MVIIDGGTTTVIGTPNADPEPLFRAVWDGRKGDVKKLANEGTPLDAVYSKHTGSGQRSVWDGYTVLSAAVYAEDTMGKHGMVDVVANILIEKGSFAKIVSTPDSAGKTPLDDVASRGMTKAFGLFLKNGAVVTENTVATAASETNRMFEDVLKVAKIRGVSIKPAIVALCNLPQDSKAIELAFRYDGSSFTVGELDTLIKTVQAGKTDKTEKVCRNVVGVLEKAKAQVAETSALPNAKGASREFIAAARSVSASADARMAGQQTARQKTTG